MARPWRIQFPGAIYHVTSRGNNRQAIYLDDGDRADFLDLLSRGHARFNLQIFAFCLMTNHYHLFLRTPAANLAAALQWLNATYTGRFNRRHHRSGHLLQGRYRSVLVADEAHWLHLSIYLHLNPVRAGLVHDPADYEWSSFRDYTRPRPRFPWLAPSEVLAGYGSNENTRRRHYRQECLGLAGRQPKFWQELQNDLILGGRELRQEWARKYPPAGQAEAVPAYRKARRAQFDFAAELKRVSQAFGQFREGPCPGRKGSLARLVAYHHLVEHCGASVRQAAKLLGVGPSAVSQGIARFRRRLAEDEALRARVSNLDKL